jgi:hypothetical protein
MEAPSSDCQDAVAGSPEVQLVEPSALLPPAWHSHSVRTPDEKTINAVGLGLIGKFVARDFAEDLEVEDGARIGGENLEGSTLWNFEDGLFSFEYGQRATEPPSVERFVRHRGVSAPREDSTTQFVYANAFDASSKWLATAGLTALLLKIRIAHSNSFADSVKR